MTTHSVSQGWARAIIDLAVPYDSDIDEVEALILNTALELADEPKWKRLIMERPEVWGIEYAASESYRDYIVSQFTGASYGWMWPFRGSLERWYDSVLAELRRS